MNSNKHLEDKIDELNNQNKQIMAELDLIKKVLLNHPSIINENKNFCPFCGEYSVFENYGEIERKNVRCPNCGSVERHRMIYLLFKKRYLDIFSKQIKLLHFAPEQMFYDFFRKYENIDYYPVDIDPTIFGPHIHIREKVNMEDIPYEEGTFDFIYNSHVLEHVPDDIKAMSELRRVLKDDGICVTLVPYYDYMEETLEKEEYNTPELRSKYYGQWDHLRKYGKDFKDRLESVGFNVETVTLSDITTSKTDKELYKLGSDTFFICTK